MWSYGDSCGFRAALFEILRLFSLHPLVLLEMQEEHATATV